MLKRRIYYIAKQPSRVKVLARSLERKPPIAWLVALATAAAGIFYFYSLFFGFLGWPTITER
jgi:hypothetical protein